MKQGLSRMPALEPQTSPPTPSPKPAPGRHSPAAAAAMPDLIQFGAANESEGQYINSAPPQHAVSCTPPSKRATSTAGTRPRPVETSFLLHQPARHVLYKGGEFGQLHSSPATTAPSTSPAYQQHRQPHDLQVPAVSSELPSASDMATPPYFRPPAPTMAGLDAMCIPRASAPFTARIDLGAFEHSLHPAPPAQHAVYYATNASATCPEHGYGVRLAAGMEPAAYSTRLRASTRPRRPSRCATSRRRRRISRPGLQPPTSNTWASSCLGCGPTSSFPWSGLFPSCRTTPTSSATSTRRLSR